MNGKTPKDTDALIRGLSRGLPATTAVSPARRAIGASTAFLLYVALLAFTAFPVREDLAGRPGSFVFVVFAAVAVGLTGLFTIGRSNLLRSAPPSGRRFRPVAVGLALAAYLIGVFLYSRESAAAFAPRFQDLVCALLIVGLSLPAWIAGTAWGAWLFPTSRAYQLGLAAVGFAAGAAIINLHCPVEGHGHHLLGHGIEALALAAAATVILSPVSKRIVDRLIAGRANKLKHRAR